VLSQESGELSDNINNWSKDVFEFEKSFSSGTDLKSWYQDNKANFRIGFGSGMISTTISILLSDELRKKIRKFAGRDKQDDLPPKSRRIWLKNNHMTPFGWAIKAVLN